MLPILPNFCMYIPRWKLIESKHISKSLLYDSGLRDIHLWFALRKRNVFNIVRHLNCSLKVFKMDKDQWQ